jgi:hypothetical protein
VDEREEGKADIVGTSVQIRFGWCHCGCAPAHLFSSGHDDPKAARLTPRRTAPRRPSSLVSGLRSEHASTPRSAPAGPGDQARRATNQTRSHVALDVPRSLPWWKEDGRRVLWKASRGPGASSALYAPRSRPSLSRACAPSAGRAPGARCMCGFPACALCARRSGVASVLGEAQGAVCGAPARVEPRRARARPGGRARAAVGASLAPAARIRKQPGYRSVLRLPGGRHLPGSDTSRTPTSRVSRTASPAWGPVVGTSTDEERATRPSGSGAGASFSSLRGAPSGATRFRLLSGRRGPNFFLRLRFSRGGIYTK